MRLDILKSLNAERAARRAAVIVTDIATGAQRFVAAAGIDADPLRDILHSHLRSGKSGMEETPQGRVFLTVHVPPPRLVVTGAVHISQALAPVAALLGYDVTIVDPRTAFASPQRFPDVKLIAQWPDEALPPLGVDRYTAFAALTHDPKIDDPALLHALCRDCFYIGALGSKKTHARRLERLKAQGASEGALSRIHAPIGLAIGAVSPGEIAIAIMAEITASLRLAATASLSSPSGRGQTPSSGPHPSPSLGESRAEAGAN
jgi:xanthine dehydrogenase accessory factor